MIRTQIQLTERQMEGLRRISEHDHLSIAEIIRRSLDETLAHSLVVPRDEIRRRAESIVGRFASGQSDVSAEHDKYLDEAFSA